MTRNRHVLHIPCSIFDRQIEINNSQRLVKLRLNPSSSSQLCGNGSTHMTNADVTQMTSNARKPIELSRIREVSGASYAVADWEDE